MMTSGRRFSWVALFAALALFTLSNPYFLWNIPARNLFYLAINVFLAVVFFFNRKRKDKKSAKLIALYLFVWLAYLVLSIYHKIVNENGIITLLPVCLYGYVLTVKKEFGRAVYKYYLTIFALILGISLVFFALALSGVIKPLDTIQHYNERLDRTYSHYPFLLIEHYFAEGIRFSGPFDEPGVVGTFSAIFLCIQRFNFRNWRTVIIFVAGLFSLSLFFYTAIAVYWLCYLLFTKKKVFATLLIIGVFVTFHEATKDNAFISKRIWERLEWNTSEGRFEGDNRMNEDGDEYFNNKIRGTHQYYFGADDIEAYWDAAFGASSYKNIIAMYGVIFLALYVLIFIMLGYRSKQNMSEFMLFLFIFFINIYQRANLYYLDWFFLYGYLARISEFEPVAIHRPWKSSSYPARIRKTGKRRIARTAGADISSRRRIIRNH